MLVPSNKIELIIIYSGIEYRLQTYHGEYRDLKTFIQDRLFPEDFGQCGGMGRCATCMVEVTGLSGDASLLKRNEETTLERMAPGNGNNIRLSCQLAVDDSLANAVIRVLDVM